jgi:hypothetical protein
MMDRKGKPRERFARPSGTSQNGQAIHRRVLRPAVAIGLICAMAFGSVATTTGNDTIAHSDATYRANDFTVPQTRLQPIGAPSAVDRYTSVRQAAWMQSPDATAVPQPSLPPSGFVMPPSTGLPAPLSTPSTGPINVSPSDLYDNSPLPRNNLPGASGSGGLPMPAPQTMTTPQVSPAPRTAPPAAGTFAPVPRSGATGGQAMPSGDYAPMPQPQLGNQFATLGNCRNISAPSGYRSDRILTCGPPASYVTTIGATAGPPVYAAPPAQIGPPAILPPVQMVGPVSTGPSVVPGPAGYRPLISFGQERYPVQIGQGIFGQPTAYVPGQTFRNAIRYLTW